MHSNISNYDVLRNSKILKKRRVANFTLALIVRLRCWRSKSCPSWFLPRDRYESRERQARQADRRADGE